MHVSRAILLAALAAIAVGCSSSPTATTAPGLPTIGPGGGSGGGATQAPVVTPAGGGGGGGTVTGVTIADGTYTKGKAHVELTGDKTVTLDMNQGSGFAAGGSGVFGYADMNTQISVSIVLAAQDSGLSVAGKDIVTGGTWGKECELRMTRNDAGGVAGEFSCPNVEAADPTVLKQLKVSIKGSFSAER